MALAGLSFLWGRQAIAVDDQYPLWSGSNLGSKDDIPFLESRRSIVDRGEKGVYQFTLGADAVVHDGRLVVEWGNSRIDENDQGSAVRARRSNDGGATWTNVEVVAPGYPEIGKHCHGVLHSANGELWSFVAQHGFGPNQGRYTGLRSEAFLYDTQTKAWKSGGTFGDEGFWPLNRPVAMSNGHWIMPGIVVPDRTARAAVAISDGKDFRQWRIVTLPYAEKSAAGKAWEESAIIVQDNKVLLIARNANSRYALCATSENFGETWTPLRESNLPMATGKPTAGTLADGRHYLIANYPGEDRARRDTLFLALSKPGELSFSKIYRIIDEQSPPPRMKGEAKKPQWAYPSACEFNGKLYVVYSVTKEDTGLSVIDLSKIP